MKNKQTIFSRFKKTLLVLVLGVSMFAGLLQPAPAQATGLPTYDGGNFIRAVGEFVDGIIKYIKEDLLDDLAAVAFKNGLGMFLNNLATETANWIASGDEGQKPLLFTDQWGDYMQEAGENALAGMAIAFAEKADLGDICTSPEIAISFALPQLAFTGVAQTKPRCSLDDLKKTWDVRDPKFLENFTLSFDTNQNDLGIGVSFLAESQAKVEEEKKTAENERGSSQGFKDAVSKVAKKIQNPGSMVRNQIFGAQNDADKGVSTYTGRMVADAINSFTSTLAGQYLNKLKSGFFSLADVFSDETEDARQQLLGSLTSSTATTPSNPARFNNVFKPEIKQTSDYNVLAELSVCPTEIQYASIYNCTIDNGFVQALSPSASNSFLTIREAVAENFLHSDWSFGYVDPASGAEPSYLNGYAHSSMKKLRRLRIIPVGWELAAIRAKQLGNRVTLQNVLDGYNEIASPFYHLVDPEWVLKMPQTRCAAKMPSQILQAGGSNRIKECVDIQDCVSFGSDGECLSWGYCTNEKRVWNLPAEECSEQFATCDKYIESGKSDQNNLWLGSTLDYTGCTAESAGCTWYSLGKNAADEWQGQNRIYLTGKAEKCSSNDAGCNSYLRMGNGSNLLKNSSFEDDGGHNYVLGSGDQSADNLIPDGWSSHQSSVTLSEDALEGNYAVEINSSPGSECLPGLKYETPIGSYEVGQTYILSGRVKTDSVAAEDLQLDFHDITFTVANVGQTWKPFAFNFIMPATINKYTLVLGTNAGLCNDLNTDISVFYDAMQLERGSLPTEYKRYGVGNEINLNDAPACSFEDVGCQQYIPEDENLGIELTGIATGADVCPQECNGYSTYEQKATNLEPAKFSNFIASTATQCQAKEVGCEEYTNLDALNLGGEGKEYYARIKHCEKPQPQCATFFAWEGSDTTGFQLTSFSLFADSLDGTGAPMTTDNSTTCDPNDANCRELIDELGNRYVRNLDVTITCSDQCVPLRAPEGMVTQVECEDRLGRWDALVDRCIYQAMSTESLTCQPKAVGCREFIGTTGHNIAVVFTDNFEDNDSLGWSTGTISSEATSVGGHSLKVGEATSDVDETTDYFIADLEPGRSYTLDFSAKSSVTNFITITAWLGEDVNDSTRLGSLVTTNSSWNQYSLGPVELSNTASTIVPLTFRIEGTFSSTDIISMFFDNILVKKIKDSVFVAKDSWNTPSTCDTNPPLAGGSAGRSMVGCQAYSIDGDQSGETRYLKSFTRLCSEEKVGCEALINTHNSTPAYREIYQEGDEAEVVVPEDSVSYLVNREEFECQSRFKGCAELGKPNFDGNNTVIDFTPTYIINDPDNYGSILCKAESLSCEEFTISSGTVVYAKHPLLQQCEYREVPTSFPPRFAWFKIGDDPDTAEENPIDCVGAKDNSFTLRCPSTEISCTQYHEPITAESYYYKKNSLITNVGECNGVMDWKKGCVVFDDLSVRDKYFRSGDDVDFVGAPDGCQSGDIDCNANVLMKVNLDRQCSQWLTSVTSARFWNQNAQQYKTTSYTLGRCLEADPVNPTICKKWDNNLDKPVLSMEEYRNRDITWAGEDYSGYSIPNAYPVETLRQYNIAVDADNMPTDYRLSRLDTPPGGSQGCTTSSECPQFAGERQSCRLELDPDSGRFAGKCYLVKGIDIDEEATGSVCRGYPEKDSPFPENLAVYAPETDTKNPNQAISRHPLFQNANLGALDEDVECSYSKVTFQSETRYYGSGSVPPSEIVSDGEKVKFTTRDRFLGWEGYCLEHDPTRFINGSDNETACLTWYPVDVIQGAEDLSNTQLNAGYIVSDDSQFYCLQATFAEWLAPMQSCGACPSPYYTKVVRQSGDGCAVPFPAPDLEEAIGQTFLGFKSDEIQMFVGLAIGAFLGGAGGAVIGDLILGELLAYALPVILDTLGVGEDSFPKVLCFPKFGNGFYPKLYANGLSSNDNIMCSVVARVQSPSGRNKVATTKILDEDYKIPGVEFPYQQQSIPFGAARLGTLNPEELDSPLMIKNINQYAVNCEDCKGGVCEDEEADKNGKLCPFMPNAGSPYALFSFWPQFINDGNVKLRAGNRPLDDPQYHQPYPRLSEKGGSETAREGVERLRNLFAKSYGVWSWQVGVDNICVGTCQGGLKNGEFCDSNSTCGDTDTSVTYDCATPTAGNGLCANGMYISLSCTTNADCAFNPDDIKFTCVPTDPNDPTATDLNVCSDGSLKGLGCSVDEDCNPVVEDGICDDKQRCQAVNGIISSMSGKVCAKASQCNTGSCEVKRCSNEASGTPSILCNDLTPGDACGDSKTGNSYAEVTQFGWDTIEDAPELAERPVVQPVVPDQNSVNGLTEGFVPGGGFTLNGEISGTITAQDGRAPITASFYAYNLNGEQMPLRVIMVDWNDGTDPAAARGSFKNHKSQCLKYCSNDARLECSDDIECQNDTDPKATCDPANFGDSDDACIEDGEGVNGYFAFSHTYTCEGPDPCTFIPQVLVSDNWGAITRLKFKGSVVIEPSLTP